MNRLNPKRGFGTELSRSLDRILAAVIDRARRGIGTPAMEGANAELRRIFSLGLLCQSVLRVSVVRAGSPSGGGGAGIVVHPFGEDGPEALAREAGVSVVIAHRPLLPRGGKAPEALEQAVLLTRIGRLATEARRLGSEEDPLAGFVWEAGTPMGRAGLPGDRSVTIIAARPGGAGRGLGIATASRESAGVGRLRGSAWDMPTDIPVSFTLLVPHLPGPDPEDPSPHAWIVQLSAS